MQRAEHLKYHYIYKITRFDGKFYIGLHSTNDLNDGYFGRGKKITRSIRKHGIAKHSKEILEFLPSRKELSDREKQIVNEELLKNHLCMNLVLGGIGGTFTEEQNKRGIINAQSPEARAKRSKTRRERRNDFGSKNNSFGTKWITHPTHGNKKIKNSELDKYISNGWKLGRVLPPDWGGNIRKKLKGRTLLDIVGAEKFEAVVLARKLGREKLKQKLKQ
jgi:hypothetical protein